ncbi:MAG: hypothetical protein ACXVRJ_11420 [Gaiellaceae bacterium]
MRRVLVPLLVALAAAPAAAGNSAPAPKLVALQLRSVHVTVSRHRDPLSCSAQVRTDARIAKIADKIAPVACEQPPRSRLGLGPATLAAAAAALAP